MSSFFILWGTWHIVASFISFRSMGGPTYICSVTRVTLSHISPRRRHAPVSAVDGGIVHLTEAGDLEDMEEVDNGF